MKDLSTRAVALLCLLPFLIAVDVSHPGAGEQDRMDLPARSSPSPAVEISGGRDGQVVLDAGDQAVIVEGEHKVIITRASSEHF